MITNIDNIFYNDNRILNKNKLREIWVKTNLPDIYEQIEAFIKKNSLNFDKYSIKIYHFHNNLKEIPLCEICNKDKKRFIGFNDGYDKFCSRKCAQKASLEDALIKRKDRTVEKWGVNHTSMLPSVKEKQKETNLQKWGFVSPSLNPEVISKRKNTMIEKWGVEFSGQSNILLNKSLNTRFKKYKEHILKIYDKLNILDIPKEGTFIINCQKCGEDYEIKNELLRLRYFRYDIEPCLNCNPLSSYKYGAQNEIYDFILNFIPNSDIIRGDRKILDGKELDIYIPNINLAIEFNGLYWHSELYKSKDYHIDKKIKCQEKGINLIHIWEDDWMFKKEIIKSRLLNKLKLNDKRIFGRKCDIREVSSKDAKIFNNNNHLQGNINSSYRIGLYFENELVSLMTFGKLRKSLGSKSKEGEWELYRFCNKIGTSVQGAFSKLLNHFEKNTKPSKVFTYANRDWSCDENVYEKNGFKFDGYTDLNYWYFNGSLKRQHRFNFRKDKIIKIGVDSKLTEKEIMRNLGWNIVWDCGSIKYSKIYLNK